MQDSYFIGIDPGVSGALACLDKNGIPTDIITMPVIKIGTKNILNMREIVSWFKKIMTNDPIKMVAIEEQRSFNKIGSVATFGMGRGYGMLEAIISTLDLPYRIIRPVDWQKEMFKGLPKGKGMTKQHSKTMAQQLYPTLKFHATPRCTKVHDGMTDAVLIAEYIRRETK